MNTLKNINNLHIPVDVIQDKLFLKNNVAVSILRLDKIHPVISGNKLFKLHHFLQRAISSHKKVITFGGAFSNHLAATAMLCKNLNISCIGIVRGEKFVTISNTLLFCEQQGMRLKFIGRAEYSKKHEDTFIENLQSELGDHILIPEGGYSRDGVKGAAVISQYYSARDYTHICCAVGTGTTIAGLMASGHDNQQFIGFSALKNLNDFEIRMQYLLPDNTKKKFRLINDFHFGGYAKRTDKLISFMNKFYEKHLIPLDFVYTGKMMYGILALTGNKYFPHGSKILCIHTGGLQGNISLPEGLLNF